MEIRNYSMDHTNLHPNIHPNMGKDKGMGMDNHGIFFCNNVPLFLRFLMNLIYTMKKNILIK